MGIFMLEARSITSAILQGKPATLRDLTALMATHRPHTLDLLRELVSRMSGSCEQKVAAPGVGETLADSYGLLIYQEQLMRIAMSVGQFDGHGANRLLMAAGKRQLDVLDQLHPVFVEGTVKSGLTIVEAERLWENLIEAAPTLFLKAHAVCMATLAYRMAYLKTHYSEAFLRAADRLRLD
jgi:DNA polymerase-3 subunit alpha